jgi:hypothetical protein
MNPELERQKHPYSYAAQTIFQKRIPMAILLKKIPLENGLVIYVYDHTRRYYGDFYHVKIEITCDISLNEKYFENVNDYADAQNILGKSVSYNRFLEQMGVPSTGIEHVREKLIQNFKEHSVPYFSSMNFPGKFVLSHYNKSKKKSGLKVSR